MRCPKCGYISFDSPATCGGCSTDFTATASLLQGTGVPATPGFFLQPVFEPAEHAADYEEELDRNIDPDSPMELDEVQFDLDPGIEIAMPDEEPIAMPNDPTADDQIPPDLEEEEPAQELDLSFDEPPDLLAAAQAGHPGQDEAPPAFALAAELSSDALAEGPFDQETAIAMDDEEIDFSLDDIDLGGDQDHPESNAANDAAGLPPDLSLELEGLGLKPDPLKENGNHGQNDEPFDLDWAQQDRLLLENDEAEPIDDLSDLFGDFAVSDGDEAAPTNPDILDLELELEKE